MATKPLITAEQFGHLILGDLEDYELVEGELIPLSSGTPKHAEIRDLVVIEVRSYLKANPLGRVMGEVDCQLSSDTVRRPDVAVFLGLRAEFDRNKIPIPYAPDIAVEVLSSSESAIEVRRKVREYLRAGSSEVWLLSSSSRARNVSRLPCYPDSPLQSLDFSSRNIPSLTVGVR